MIHQFTGDGERSANDHFMHVLNKKVTIFMCKGRTDFDVTIGRLQNQGYFQGDYCNTTDHCFYIEHCTITDHRFYTIFSGVVLHAVNSREIKLI